MATPRLAHAAIRSRTRFSGSLGSVDAVEAASTSVFPLTLRDGDDPARVAPARADSSGNKHWPLAYYGYATPDYFRTMGIPLIAGRSFSSQDTSVEAPGMIISASLARDLFGDDDPIGRSVDFVDFRSFWASLTVVGIVGDTPTTTIREGGSRAAYLPHLYPRVTGANVPYPYMPRWETYVIRRVEIWRPSCPRSAWQCARSTPGSR